jgi:YfiH family protein
MERVEYDELVYYRLPAWSNTKHGIFTRHGGVSSPPFGSLNLGGNVGDDPQNVRCNHERMYAALGVRGERACTVWQVHSADVVIASAPVRGRRWLAAADALMTDKPDTPLAMRYADCTPILLRDARAGVIGMAHAGWRGTVLGVSGATARAMIAAYGCQADDIEAWIGPSISVARYQVGAEVVDAVRAQFGTLDGLIRRDPLDGTAYFDLWAANRLDLARAGVERVTIAGVCTASNTGDWFSHRGEGGRTGRFGAVMAL